MHHSIYFYNAMLCFVQVSEAGILLCGLTMCTVQVEINSVYCTAKYLDTASVCCSSTDVHRQWLEEENTRQVAVAYIAAAPQ